MPNAHIEDEVWEFSISQHPLGARCQHDKRDAHDSSWTQKVSEAIMCGTFACARGTTAQWQSKKISITPFKAWTSHTSINGPYQDYQFKLSLHTPHNKN
jgi:hypothetical protein